VGVGVGVRPSGGDLDDAPLLRLLHEGLALQHVGEVGGAQAKRRRRLLGGRGRGRVQADLRRRMAAAAAAYGGLIGLVRRGRITGLSLACVCVCIRLPQPSLRPCLARAKRALKRFSPISFFELGNLHVGIFLARFMYYLQ
jgi:hypothetical protein